VILVADVYGVDSRPKNPQEAGAATENMYAHRGELRARINAALAQLKAQGVKAPLDGTHWGGSEVLAAGLTTHQGGLLEAFGQISASRKLLIHIPSSDPILDERSVQRATLDRLGIEVAYDGMEIQL